MAKRLRSEEASPADHTLSHEELRYGPIVMRRFGRAITVTSLLSRDEHDSLRAHLAATLPDVCAEISHHVAAIRRIVASHDPLDLLRRAYFESVLNRVNLTKESELDSSHGNDLRMLDYLQSVVTATQIADKVPAIDDGTWATLRGHVASLYSALNGHYFPARSAAASKSPTYDNKKDALYTWAMMHRCNVRGARYVEHERSHLQDLLGPHTDELQRLFGASADAIVDGIGAIVEMHLRGTLSCFAEIKRLHAQWASQVDGDELAENMATMGPEAAVRYSVAKLGLADELNTNLEMAFGFGLFDVAQIAHLPEGLIAELSMCPGDDHGLFDASQQSGWPIKYRVTLDKPFLRIDGKSYCFDIYTLLDGFYRAIGRLVRLKDPGYVDEWNLRQNAISEAIPVKLISQLLPGALVFERCHYRYRDSRSGRQAWAEADIVVRFDDVLLVVEVKAGAFLPVPPSPDMEEYLDSVQRILLEPADQGGRLAEPIRNGQTIALYAMPGKKPNNDRPIVEIDGREIRVCCVVAVSVDQLTHIASTIQHHTGRDASRETLVWRISIDDLRIYVDMFRNPLVFCHFLEERLRAAACGLIDAADEMDHFGLYTQSNCYGLQAEQARGDFSRILFNGCRDIIDEYYCAKMVGDDASPPRQRAPAIMYRVLDVLHVQGQPGRCEIASLLLAMNEQSRDLLWSSVEDVLSQVLTDGAAHPVSVQGDIPVTVLVEPRSGRHMEEGALRDYSMACMILAEDDKRLVLKMEVDAVGVVECVAGYVLRRDGFDADTPARLQDHVAKLRSGRLAMARGGDIGRNDSCPCGSGRKYKRCCIDRN